MLTPDLAIDLFGQGLRLVLLLVAVLILPGLLVGLLVSLFQAATQINEQTLSFLPRLIATLLALLLTAHWMTGSMMDFCVSIFQRAAHLAG